MRGGALAQLVEQWTENPCVPGSIPGGTTLKTHFPQWVFYFLNTHIGIYSSYLLENMCKFS
jgi:hypothetical protein